MPIRLNTSTKINFSRHQFAVFGQAIYETFLTKIEETDRKRILRIAPDWEAFLNGLHSAKGDGLSDLPLVFADIVFDTLKSDKQEVGQPLAIILKDSARNSRLGKAKFKDWYAKQICNFLGKTYYNYYRLNKKPFFSIGGARKAEDHYKSIIFFWFIGCEGFQAFKNKYKKELSGEGKVEDSIEHLSYLFNRRGEFVDIPATWEIEGVWKMEALEGEAHADRQNPRIVEEGLSNLKMIHNRNIEYKSRYAYWGELTIRKSEHRGYFIGQGKLQTNTAIPELESWTLKFICSVRLSHKTYYINMDYEMFPRENIQSPRTFGTAMFRNPQEDDFVPQFRGYFFSNRMRDPDNKVDDDEVFTNSLRISMGQAVFYKAR